MLNMLNQDNYKVILAAAFVGIADPKAAMQKMIHRMAVNRNIAFEDKVRVKNLMKRWYLEQYGVEYWGADPKPRRRMAA